MEYIDNPLLIEGHKFEVRYSMCALQHGPVSEGLWVDRRALVMTDSTTGVWVYRWPVAVKRARLKFQPITADTTRSLGLQRYCAQPGFDRGEGVKAHLFSSDNTASGGVQPSYRVGGALSQLCSQEMMPFACHTEGSASMIL